MTSTVELTAKEAAIINVAGELKGWAIVLAESDEPVLQELAAALGRISDRLFEMLTDYRRRK